VSGFVRRWCARWAVGRRGARGRRVGRVARFGSGSFGSVGIGSVGVLAVGLDPVVGRGGERGSATVWTVAGLAVVMAVMSAALWFGAAVVTRHRAEAAADLGALAAAAVAVGGERRACAEARWVADQMGVSVRSCRLSGWDALVEVVAVPPGVLGQFGSAEARARAGPVADTAYPSSTVVHTR
jgi:secretion/DNA translocation related TadE-like protein